MQMIYLMHITSSNPFHLVELVQGLEYYDGENRGRLGSEGGELSTQSQCLQSCFQSSSLNPIDLSGT